MLTAWEARQMAHQEKNSSEYIYSSSEVSKFYGITIKGMEFYEEKGIVHPQRVGQSKIRRFTLSDSYRLYYARLLRNSGVSIPETLDVLEHNSFDHAEELLGRHIREMRNALRVQQRTMECLERTVNLLRLAEDDEVFCETIPSGGFYRLFLRRFSGPHESNCEETLEYRSWNDFLPITAASLRFPLSDCLKEEGDMDTSIGLIMEEADFKAFDFRESDRTQFIPAGQFVHTIICGPSLRLCSRDWLRPALEYIAEKSLRLTGDAFSRLIFVANREGQSMRCDEAWFPVAADES